MDFKTLENDIKKFLNKLEQEDPELNVELVLEKPPLDAWIPPAEIEENHPIVESCIKAAEYVLSFRPEKVGEPFGTESSFYANMLNIPTISSFGPGFIKLAHGPDEYIDIDSIIAASKIYALTSLNYFNTKL